MQIQDWGDRPGRSVKSRRVGGGSNFHETFPRMNEGPEDRTTSSTRRAYLSSTLLFSSLFFSVIFHCLPLPRPLSPVADSVDLAHRFACSFRPYLLSIRHSHASASTSLPAAAARAERSCYSSLPSSPHLIATSFVADSSRFYLRVRRRRFPRLFRNFRTTPPFLRRGGESRELSTRKCESTVVDYTRKIVSDGPSTVLSTECMHFECIGSATCIYAVRGCQNIQRYRERETDMLPYPPPPSLIVTRLASVEDARFKELISKICARTRDF